MARTLIKNIKYQIRYFIFWKTVDEETFLNDTKHFKRQMKI